MLLRPLAFEELPGWSPDELVAVWPAYLAAARAVVEDTPPLRPGAAPTRELSALCNQALDLGSDPDKIARFFRERFQPHEVLNERGGRDGFVTGYYEPELEGSLVPTPDFTAPILARPHDLLDVRAAGMAGWDPGIHGARTNAGGELEPYPTRRAIECGAIDAVTTPILWLRDHVEVFFAQVQGSARVRLPDGAPMRLVYAGRNGRPYNSIGRILIESGEIPAEQISLARCKEWLRANGLRQGDPGRTVLQRNESYVFFRLEDDTDSSIGPVGAQGVPLVALRSMAVDRTVWPYGTPIWIGADLVSAGLGDGRTGRLMVAQDTGSAIVGPARGDLFIGSGDRAGEIAGLIRHPARFFVFAPSGTAAHGAS